MKTTLLFLFVFLTSSLFGQNVYIPDANFKALLLVVSQINTNGDTEIQVSEASAYDGILVLDDENISDLTGIEAFTALTFLNCSYNQLTSLDVSQNTALTTLDCRYNQLTSLDVSQNTSIKTLQCGGNQLTSLDVSQNIALESLWCESNQLTSLNVSQNTALNEFLCHYNQLTCLNVANGNNINMNYSFQFWAGNNPNLTCIEVDDVAFSTANWTNIDPQTSFSVDCNNDCLPCISTSSMDIQAACDSYTWIDGNTYTSSNNSATFLTTNSAGCDSVITLDLTINTSSIGTDVQEICSGEEYTWIDGNIYTEPNSSATYTMVGSGANGCDSIVTLNLNVISVPEPIIIQNGNMLSCDNFATAYQWLDCDDNYAPIEGATDMVFTATQNGSYALEITFDECSDTSDCYDIDFVGISETNSIPKQIVKIIELMGRETSFKPNTPLIYVYDDGTTEKVFSVEY